ncbi:MAG TPA: hypothetical protein VNV43_07410 [Candidatus Acidoferrales bacterium]|jgi:hypothetical protein|nr:hypothetical protein [Candidatus Acidoferrales bacterium]
MELKVACDCGQKYKFDVDPVEGRMPFAVNCPTCGVDGTPAANQLLAQHVALVPTAPLTVAEPAPAAAGGLRINRPAPAAAAPPLFANSAAPAPLPGVAPLSAIKPLTRASAGAPKEFSMGRGALGAFLGSVVGGALVLGFFYWAGFRFPLTGTIIGVLSGLGARMLARGTDNVLGAISGAFALASVVGVFLFMYGDFFLMGIFSIVICVSFAYRIASS